MKKRIKRAAERAAANPVLRQSARSLKPGTGFWGIVGVLAFFILPELVAFAWGPEITAWAHGHYLTEPIRLMRLNYWMVEKLFEDGGSWVNLGLGVALLIWIAWERRRQKRY
ncbi:hypothetical protein [Nitratifractor sp.]|uniref:hypothetical protein n=1 Tax=Nitratifractor sp. TaxID=2268144 RepID=UPI0025F251D7|nr:hypothetical protein [Nitratifractor sp.]